ncbi:MAG: hypothetical protein K1X64_03915 [Myxococcaceae bacterium]|nr:hypothetical protein [Myxococcaceae bacterium]
MLKTFRVIKSILISGALAAGCSVAGVHGIYERVTYEAPTPTTCADLDMSKQGGWIVVEGCEALFWDAVVEETKKSKTVRAVSVPLRSKGSLEEPRIVLSTANEKMLSAVRAVKKSENGIDPEQHTPDEVQQNRGTVLQALKPVTVPRFQARVEGPPSGELAKLMPNLPSATVVVRQVDEGKPGVWWPLFLLLTGVFWGLSALSSVLSLNRPAFEPDDAPA